MIMIMIMMMMMMMMMIMKHSPMLGANVGFVAC